MTDESHAGSGETAAALTPVPLSMKPLTFDERQEVVVWIAQQFAKDLDGEQLLHLRVLQRYEATCAGFTAEDVAMLNRAAILVEHAAHWCPEGWTTDNPLDQIAIAESLELAARYRSLASRIRALLPPSVL